MNGPASAEDLKLCLEARKRILKGLDKRRDQELHQAKMFAEQAMKDGSREHAIGDLDAARRGYSRSRLLQVVRDDIRKLFFDLCGPVDEAAAEPAKTEEKKVEEEKKETDEHKAERLVKIASLLMMRQPEELEARQENGAWTVHLKGSPCCGGPIETEKK